MVLRWGAKVPASYIGDEKYVSGPTTRFLFRSTRSELARRKSAPNRGKDTPAMTKSPLYCFNTKHNRTVHILNVLILLPLPATSKAPSCAVWVIVLVLRKTLTSAPVSIRKQPSEILSHMKSKPSLQLDATTPTYA